MKSKNLLPIPFFISRAKAITLIFIVFSGDIGNPQIVLKIPKILPPSALPATHNREQGFNQSSYSLVKHRLNGESMLSVPFPDIAIS